jgi:ABC-type Mn2+/Zn2+ transport system permease subunit
VPKASAFDRARAFVADNSIPIALAAFVILMVAAILLLWVRRRNQLRSETR